VASRTAFQSHTYAGSSARALANGAALLNELDSWLRLALALALALAPTQPQPGAALLNELDSWRASVRAIEAEIAPIIAELNKVV
jgi:hypothetical protein